MFSETKSGGNIEIRGKQNSQENKTRTNFEKRTAITSSHWITYNCSQHFAFDVIVFAMLPTHVNSDVSRYVTYCH